MNIPEYDRRSRQVHAMYARADADAAALIARQLHIDYIFIGPAEMRSNPSDQLTKFDGRPELFRPVFANSATRIYEVRGGQ